MLCVFPSKDQVKESVLIAYTTMHQNQIFSCSLCSVSIMKKYGEIIFFAPIYFPRSVRQYVHPSSFRTVSPVERQSLQRALDSFSLFLAKTFEWDFNVIRIPKANNPTNSTREEYSSWGIYQEKKIRKKTFPYSFICHLLFFYQIIHKFVVYSYL